MFNNMIPKIFHFVWVGDESREPKKLIQSWKDHHPEYEVHIYRNHDLFEKDWIFKKDMMAFFERKHYCGVADLIRWEMLYEHGGIALDADSLCLQKLPDWIHHTSIAACWDHSRYEGYMLSNGLVAAMPQNKTIKKLIDLIQSRPLLHERWSWSRFKKVPIGAWRTVGPMPFTEVAIHSGINEISCLPSHFFLPKKPNGERYQGDGPVYACQFWLSTHNQDIVDIEKKIDAIKAEWAVHVLSFAHKA